VVARVPALLLGPLSVIVRARCEISPVPHFYVSAIGDGCFSRMMKKASAR
jgi:hypothetical protein